MTRKFYTHLAYAILRFIDFFCRISPSSLLPFIGRTLGDIAYFFSIHRKALTRANLSIALGKDKRKLARKVFQHLGINLVEFLSLQYLTPQEINKWCYIKGEKNLTDAIKQGKGVIFLSAHFGNWELIGARLASDGFQVVSPARPQDEFEKYIKRIRDEKGFKTLPVDEGLLPLLSFLKKGYIVCILSDQNILFGGVEVPFLGIPTSTPPGAAILALRSKVPILPVFDVRVGRHHIIHILPPLQLLRDGNFREDVINNTAMFNKIIEEWVLKYPEQWLWLHNRWRLGA